jgi:hypothetical protein
MFQLKQSYLKSCNGILSISTYFLLKFHLISTLVSLYILTNLNSYLTYRLNSDPTAGTGGRRPERERPIPNQLTHLAAERGPRRYPGQSLPPMLGPRVTVGRPSKPIIPTRVQPRGPGAAARNENGPSQTSHSNLAAGGRGLQRQSSVKPP